MRAWLLALPVALLLLSASAPPARGGADCDFRVLDSGGVLAVGCGADGTWVWAGAVYDCGSGTSVVFVSTDCG